MNLIYSLSLFYVAHIISNIFLSIFLCCSAKLGKSVKSAKSSKSLKVITATITKPGPPGCYDVAFACTSEKLLEGVGLFELPGRSFPPFTTDGCPDGNKGDYLEDESVEQITVSAVDGDKLQAGRMAKIDAEVHA